MKKPFAPKALTANDLLTGHVIWRKADGGWSKSLEDAAIYTAHDTAEHALSAATQDAHIAVGAYLVDVVRFGDGLRPSHVREAIRIAGPSHSVLPNSARTA